MADQVGTYIRMPSGLWQAGRRIATPPAAFYDNAPVTMPTSDMIVGNRRFTNIMHEDFLTDVPIGGFVAKANSPGSGLLLPVNGVANPYAATTMAYPSGIGASHTGVNRPEKVLSASNSCLNMNFSVDTNGDVLCATVHYLVGTGDHGGTWYPGYQVDPAVGGRFMFRFRVVGGDMLDGWGAVSQLIADDADWGAMHGEMDLNEGSVATGNIMQTNWHQYQAANTFAPWPNGSYGNKAWGSDWHNTTYDWIPVGDPLEPAGRETVWIDGVKVGESLGDRIAQNWRAFFAFQTGGNATPPPAAGTANRYGGIYPANGVVRGQMQIDWVSVYRPTTI